MNEPRTISGTIFGTILTIAMLAAFVLAADARAQAEQTPEKLLDESLTEAPAEVEPEPEEGAVDEAEEGGASREVDFNEENFRRSMELRDAALQRSPGLTTGSYSPGTGVKALDELPEASQKHLREQLREVIVENGPWTPEEAGESYPYQPSAEAMENGTLEKREQAAWSELVAKYHEREAAIHANTVRTRAATGNAGAEGSQAENSATESGSESDPGDNSETAQRAAALAELLESRGAAGAESDAGEAPPTDQGVSQNALELLTERQQLPTGAAAPEATEGQAASDKEHIELDSEGVIAIEDLEKVELDPEAAEKD